jgi:hypothetical protein
VRERWDAWWCLSDHREWIAEKCAYRDHSCIGRRRENVIESRCHTDRARRDEHPFEPDVLLFRSTGSICHNMLHPAPHGICLERAGRTSASNPDALRVHSGALRVHEGRRDAPDLGSSSTQASLNPPMCPVEWTPPSLKSSGVDISHPRFAHWSRQVRPLHSTGLDNLAGYRRWDAMPGVRISLVYGQASRI